MLPYFSDTRNIKQLDTVGFSFLSDPSNSNLGSDLTCKKPNKNNGKQSDSIAFKLNKCIKVVISSFLLGGCWET